MSNGEFLEFIFQREVLGTLFIQNTLLIVTVGVSAADSAGWLGTEARFEGSSLNFGCINEGNLCSILCGYRLVVQIEGVA